MGCTPREGVRAMIRPSQAQEQRTQRSDVKHWRVIIENDHREKLVGILHKTGSKELVIICHGFQSSKTRHSRIFKTYNHPMLRESEGSFQYGNYLREAEDLRSLVQHFRQKKRVVSAIVGHSKGKFQYRVTEESLMDRLSTDAHAACLLIHQNSRVLTVHGSMDQMVAITDALEFAKFLPNHKLHIIQGADREFTSHQDELA